MALERLAHAQNEAGFAQAFGLAVLGARDHGAGAEVVAKVVVHAALDGGAEGANGAAAFTGGEWVWLSSQGLGHIEWSWALTAVLVFVAIGPSLLAYRCWGAGVQRAGPTVASFFSNLTPLFAALLSLAFLGEAPQLFHAVAFVLIVLGIVVTSARAG